MLQLVGRKKAENIQESPIFIKENIDWWNVEASAASVDFKRSEYLSFYLKLL